MKTIKFNHLCQNYGMLESLVDITFELKSGYRYLLTGPLKAGKSSIFKYLKGFLEKRRGGAQIGKDRFKPLTQDKMVYLAENTHLMGNFTLHEFIQYYQRIYQNFQIGKAIRLLKEFNISTRKKVKRLSQEDKEIVLFVLSMCRKADLYLIDDPMTSLNSVDRIHIIKTVFSTMDKKACIVFATDLIDNIKDIFHKLIFLYEGHLVYTKDISDIKENSTMELFDEYSRKRSLGRNRS